MAEEMEDFVITISFPKVRLAVLKERYTMAGLRLELAKQSVLALNQLYHLAIDASDLFDVKRLGKQRKS